MTFEKCILADGRATPYRGDSAEGRPSPHPSVAAQGDSLMRVEAEFPRLALR